MGLVFSTVPQVPPPPYNRQGFFDGDMDRIWGVEEESVRKPRGSARGGGSLIFCQTRLVGGSDDFL